MNLSERLKKIEQRFRAEDITIEIIFYKEGENLGDLLSKKEDELKKKIDNPIFIKVIPNDSKEIEQ